MMTRPEPTRAAAVIAIVVSAIAFGACAEAGGRDTPFDNAAKAATFTEDGGARTRPACAEETNDVYVLSDRGALYAFRPATLELVPKGVMDCEMSQSQPTSMAIDRYGFAWVHYGSFSVWKVDLADLSCARTSYTPPGTSFVRFGMAFATDTRGGATEALYLADNAGGISVFDTVTSKVRRVGAPTENAIGGSAELTGSGDGELFAFVAQPPASLAQISTKTGAVERTTALPGVDGGRGWAVSFYGGDFYFYTQAVDLPAGSAVTRLRPSDGSLTVVNPNVGFTIVGAGVSTCVPTAPR